MQNNWDTVNGHECRGSTWRIRTQSCKYFSYYLQRGSLSRYITDAFLSTRSVSYRIIIEFTTPLYSFGLELDDVGNCNWNIATFSLFSLEVPCRPMSGSSARNQRAPGHGYHSGGTGTWHVLYWACLGVRLPSLGRPVMTVDWPL